MANPIVTITMEDGGVIKAELYPEIAPNTVNNFISLINRKFYDGVIFHRVIPGFMIQTELEQVVLVTLSRVSSHQTASRTILSTQQEFSLWLVP